MIDNPTGAAAGARAEPQQALRRELKAPFGGRGLDASAVSVVGLSMKHRGIQGKLRIMRSREDSKCVESGDEARFLKATKLRSSADGRFRALGARSQGRDRAGAAGRRSVAAVSRRVIAAMKIYERASAHYVFISARRDKPPDVRAPRAPRTRSRPPNRITRTITV